MKKTRLFGRLLHRLAPKRQFIRVTALGLALLTGGTHIIQMEGQNAYSNPSNNPFADSPNFNSFILDIPVFEPGKPFKLTVNLGESDRPFSLLLAQLPDKRICAVGCHCPYDDKTDLSGGLIIKNKLICQEHGCEFDLLNGMVEHPPALDSLPVFAVSKVRVEGSDLPKLHLAIPHYPPAKIRPMVVGQAEPDFRKIAIVGAGAAGLGAAETLRRMLFAGEITVFTWDSDEPIQRHNLTKFSSLKGNEDFLLLRDKTYWKRCDVNILYGKEVKRVELSDDFGFVELVSGEKYYFDAGILASGATGRPAFNPIKLGQNLILLNTLEDFKRAERILPKAQRVAINGLTLEALELASTLRRDFPNIEVHLFQQAPENLLKNELGREVYDALVARLRQAGCKFHLNHHIQTLRFDSADNKISHISYGNNPQELRTIATDLLYHFDPTTPANTDFLDKVKYQDDVQKNERKQIEVNQQQRTMLNFFYAAGSCSATNDAASQENIVAPSFADAYFQGETAIYNLLGLSMPNNRTASNHFRILEKTFHRVGTQPKPEEIHVQGDKSGLSFIAYYVSKGNLLAAFGSAEYARELMLIREALNNGYVLSYEGLQDNPDSFYDRLLTSLNEKPVVVCRRQIIFDKRNGFSPRQTIWKEREDLDELYQKKFTNLKPKSL